MNRIKIVLLFVFALSLCFLNGPVVSQSTSVKFRSPISGSYFFTTYYDDNFSSPAYKDYKCGTMTYNEHAGVDFAASQGTSIYASASGSVVYYEDKWPSGYYGSKDGKDFLGNQVRIFHPAGSSGWLSIYGHMKQWSIYGAWETKFKKPYCPATPFSITCGELIGGVGTSGCSSGNHLHFQIQSNMSATDYSYSRSKSKDPFTGKCSQTTTYWTGVDQNGKPTTTCQ